MFQKFITNIPLISLGILILSFVYLDGYYKVFQVEIINYITTSEIFSNLLPLAAIYVSLGLGLITWMRETPIFYRNITKRSDDSKPKHKYRIFWPENRFLIVSILLAVVMVAIHTYVGPYRLKPLVGLLVMSLVVLSIGDYIIIPLFKGERTDIPAIVVAFGLFGWVIQGFGTDKAWVTRSLGNDKIFSFKHEGKTYKTDKSLIYVGETQSAFFLFRKSDTSTIVLNRSQVDSFVVKRLK